MRVFYFHFDNLMIDFDRIRLGFNRICVIYIAEEIKINFRG